MSNTNVNINNNGAGCGCSGCVTGLMFWLVSPFILAAIGAAFWAFVGLAAAAAVYVIVVLIAALINERRNTK